MSVDQSPFKDAYPEQVARTKEIINGKTLKEQNCVLVVDGVLVQRKSDKWHLKISYFSPRYRGLGLRPSGEVF